jgi:ribosomal-protein-serine acetyltransferase
MLAYSLGDGVQLRDLEAWHAPEFFAAVDGARDYLRPWIPFATKVTDVVTARELLQRFAVFRAEDTGRMYGIWVDGKLCGGTLFKDFNAHMGVCEVGVWLVPEAAGRGLVNKAVKVMARWAFQERGMHRIEWLCDPANERSIAAAQRLGMTVEGVQRGSWMLNGERKDTMVFALLATDPVTWIRD